jgi:hypothetical protein
MMNNEAASRGRSSSSPRLRETSEESAQSDAWPIPIRRSHLII